MQPALTRRTGRNVTCPVAGKTTIRQPHDEPVQKANETRYGRSKASDGSALKGASSEVRRIGDKVSLNEAETLPVGIASVGTAVNALQRMCQVRECAVELRIQLAKPGSEIRGGREAWYGIRVLRNGHNASVVRCLSSEWAIHGRG